MLWICDRGSGTDVAFARVMKIIAATDFSPAAGNAARSAARLARKLGDAVLLVRVIEPTVAIYPELRIPDAALFDAAVRESVRGEMDAAVAALRAEDVPVEGLVLLGSPVARLAAEAAEQRARLIVMGTHGRSAVSRFFVGSVAERTVLEAPCPVLVVSASAAPFEEWKVAGRPLRVIAGLDLDAAGEAVIASLEELRQAGACDVTFIHTYWPPAEYARLGLPGPRDIVSTDPDVVAVLKREIEARFGLRAAPGETSLRVHAAWGRPGDALADDAQAERADLLVVGTRQRHGWARLKSGSSAIAALRTAQSAVLCVPAAHGKETMTADLSIPLFRTVLCPTDFSDLGNTAVQYAYALLRGAGGTVELCHVHERHATNPALPYALTAPMPAEKRAELEAALQALVPGEAERLGITTHVTVVDGGTAAAAIVQAARRLGTDVTVLASHGRAGVTGVLLASVAEEVLRQSDKPVFVVRPQEIPLRARYELGHDHGTADTSRSAR
jgi:nucleotide-binding universal stress UspA family protein